MDYSLRGCVIQILVATFSCHSYNRRQAVSALYDFVLVHIQIVNKGNSSRLPKEIKADQK